MIMMKMWQASIRKMHGNGGLAAWALYRAKILNDPTFVNNWANISETIFISNTWCGRLASGRCTEMEALQPLEETMEELGGGDFLEVFDDHCGHELSSSSLNVIIIIAQMNAILSSDNEKCWVQTIFYLQNGNYYLSFLMELFCIIHSFHCYEWALLSVSYIFVSMFQQKLSNGDFVNRKWKRWLREIIYIDPATRCGTE